MDKGHNAGELSCRLWPDMDGPMENLVYARLKPDTHAAARQNKKTGKAVANHSYLHRKTTRRTTLSSSFLS